LSAALPTRSIFASAASGSDARPLFLSSTRDLETASRAVLRASSLARSPAAAAGGNGEPSNSPLRSLTRKIRVTASSIRLIGTVPASTSAIVSSMKRSQSSGTMNMSIPALIACGQWVRVQPSTCSMAFQSDTTKPSKLSSPLSTSVISSPLPCILPWASPVPVSVQLLYDTITVCTPASSAPR